MDINIELNALWQILRAVCLLHIRKQYIKCSVIILVKKKYQLQNSEMSQEQDFTGPCLKLHLLCSDKILLIMLTTGSWSVVT